MFDSIKSLDGFPMAFIALWMTVPFYVFFVWYWPRLRDAEKALRAAESESDARESDLDATRAPWPQGLSPARLRHVFEADQAARRALQRRQATFDRLVANLRIFSIVATIIIVSILFLSFYRPATVPDRPLPATSALEDLVRIGIKDLETLNGLLTRSRPLVGGTTIDGPVSVSGTVTGGVVVPALWGVGVLVALVGGILLLLWGYRWAGTFLAVGSTAVVLASTAIQQTSLLKGVTFFKDFTLFEIKDAKVDLLPNLGGGGRRSPDSIIVLNVQPGTDKPPEPVWASNVEFVCQVEEKDNPKSKVSLKVKTFVPGKTDELTDDKNAKAVDVLRDQIHALARDKALVGLLLIGSADTQPMTPGTEIVQYSNLSLAHGRAAWVGSRLKDNKDYPEISGLSTIVVLGAPPSHVGKAVPAKDLADDRSVIACVLLSSKLEK